MASIVVGSTAFGFAVATMLQPDADLPRGGFSARASTPSPGPRKTDDREARSEQRQQTLRTRAIVIGDIMPQGNSPAINRLGPEPGIGHANLGRRSREIVSACLMNTTG